MSVRLAKAEDYESLLDLCAMAHAESGLYPYAPELVDDIVRPVLHGEKTAVPTVIGVCGPPGDLHASMCLMATKAYYTHFYGFRDLWCFVHPDHRRSTHHKDLLEWAKGVAERMSLTLMSGVVSTDRTEAKLRLYRRQFGQPVGGYYFWYKPSTSILEVPRREDEITA